MGSALFRAGWRLAIGGCCGAILVLLAGCVSTDPKFPVEPRIEFVSISPATVQDGVTPLFITLRYTDGDGDLGYEDKFSEQRDSADLILLDRRPEVANFPEYDGRFEYNLPNLTPDAKNLSIQGEVTIEFAAIPLKLDPLANEEKLSFSIYVVDRAGHRSNTVETTEITLVP